MGQSTSRVNSSTLKAKATTYEQTPGGLAVSFAPSKLLFYLITRFLDLEHQTNLAQVNQSCHKWQGSRKDILVYEHDCPLTTHIDRAVLERLIKYIGLEKDQEASIIRTNEWENSKKFVRAIRFSSSGSAESRVPILGTFVKGLAMNRADFLMDNIDSAELRSLAIIMPQEDSARGLLPSGWNMVSFDNGIFANPLAQLRHLVLDHVLLTQPISLLRSRSPLLEDLRITFCEIQNDPEFGNDFVNFQSLRALNMSFKDYSSATLSNLVLPQHLKLLRIFISNSCNMLVFATHCEDLELV
jgi:hypothetical protein